MSWEMITSDSGLIQQTGLASGLNTNAIVQAQLSLKELPLRNLASEVSGLQSTNNHLAAIQGGLRTLVLDAQALSDPSLFAPAQTVRSTNPTLVSASSTSGVGAVIGSSTVEVDGLAAAAQRTFAFSSPSDADTITIDGQPVVVAAGASTADLARTINTNGTLDVWASAASSGQLVLSTRTTGNTGGSFIAVSDPGITLTEIPALAQDGIHAQYKVNGTAGASPTDTVAGAMTGVTLTLNGVTSATEPVTVTVNPPGPSVDSILSAVKQFVADYNASASTINAAVGTAPANKATGGSYNPNSGSLFGDNALRGVLTQMRSSIYAAQSGLPTGLAALSDIGITTGKSGGGINAAAVSGTLTLDADKLTAAIEANPAGVKAILQSWSASFATTVGNVGGAGGTLDTRMQGNSNLSSRLNGRYATSKELFSNQQQSMQQRWAKIEGALSSLKRQQTYLTSYSSSTKSS